jgi:hypothetical protein
MQDAPYKCTSGYITHRRIGTVGVRSRRPVDRNYPGRCGVGRVPVGISCGIARDSNGHAHGDHRSAVRRCDARDTHAAVHRGVACRRIGVLGRGRSSTRNAKSQQERGSQNYPCSALRPAHPPASPVALAVGNPRLRALSGNRRRSPNYASGHPGLRDIPATGK